MGSIHNELRSAGRIAVGILDALGVEESEAGVERFGETLQPILDVWSRPEWAVLRGERLWGVAPSQIQVAAEFSQVGIRNPAGSNRIVVVEGFVAWAIVGTAAVIQLDVLTGPAVAVTATGTVQSRDTRFPSQTGLTTLGIATHQAAQLGSRLFTAVVNDGLYNRYPLDVVLSPGFDLYAGPGIVNSMAAVSFWGYERPAFKRELIVRS